jgi:nicotinamidase/pyrazinamidase
MDIDVQQLRQGDALLLVDVQIDFCPQGALPIDEGDQVVPLLNAWIDAFSQKQLPIYASRDWHPLTHLSFKPQSGLWPPHCVQDTPGAAFHPDLQLPPDTVKITKGVRFDQDQNSAFDQTGLAFHLRQRQINRLWIGGLALDVCVLATVLDGIKEGFEVHLIEKGSRPVNDQGGKEALGKMKEAGVVVVA